MAEHIIIATPEISNLATITAGSESGTMTATNLLTDQPSEVWRAPDLESAYVELDLLSSTAINLLWIGYTNCSPDATMRWRAAATQGDLTADPAYDSGAINVWPHAAIETDWDYMHGLHWLGASGAQTYRWWRLDLADPAPRGPKQNGAFTAASYLQAGRIILAKAWQPPRNLRYGWGNGWLDPSPSQESAAGQTYSDELARKRRMTFTLQAETEDELYENAFQIDRRFGASRGFLVSRDPSNARRLMDQTIYGRNTDVSEPIVNHNFKIYAKRYGLTELL